MEKTRVAFWSILFASIAAILLLYFNFFYFDLPLQSITITPILGAIAGAAVHGLMHSRKGKEE